jgi:hypothetical protein
LLSVGPSRRTGVAGLAERFIVTEVVVPLRLLEVGRLLMLLARVMAGDCSDDPSPDRWLDKRERVLPPLLPEATRDRGALLGEGARPPVSAAP